LAERDTIVLIDYKGTDMTEFQLYNKEKEVEDFDVAAQQYVWNTVGEAGG